MDTDLRIGMFSFVIDLDYKEPVIYNFSPILSIINKYTNLDIIVFSGFTLYDKVALEELEKLISNNKSIIFLEVWIDRFKGREQHKGYFFSNGKLIDRDIVQFFSDSKQINGNVHLMKRFLNELNTSRQIRYRGVNLCWIICGEQNVLKNLQKRNNSVVFRLGENYLLNNTFKNIYRRSDIFINPTHTQMGNQGKLSKRREFLSKGRKVYCSVSNLRSSTNSNFGDAAGLRKKLETQKSLQYCVYDTRYVKGRIAESTNEYVFKTYVISDYFNEHRKG